MTESDFIGLAKINREKIEYLIKIGILDSNENKCRSYNVGASNYSQHVIQSWSIWLDWKLNPWDADIVKRIERTKRGEDLKEKYMKIKHICDERLRQLGYEYKDKSEV